MRREYDKPADVKDHAANPGSVNAGLWIGVLGPLTVVCDGTRRPALPGGQRAVLGLLALASGSPMRMDAVIDALWRGTPPVSATSIVQTYISRLRSLLGPACGTDGRVVIRDGAGYRLAATETSLDVLAFRRRLAEAVQAREARQPAAACTAYERALALWRGEPAADIDVLRGHPAVIALANERAAAVLDYADIAATEGWHGRVLPHLRALASRNPLDEASQSRLMIALAGSGRQAEALEVYEKVRRRLDKELGVVPGPAFRDAHAKVLRQQISLPSEPSGSADRWLPLFQLPAAPADFTGRAAESARLVAAVTPRPDQSGVPLAVVSGPPGAGKTALALHVAHTVRAQFPDGQLWVHLAGTSARPRGAGEVLGEFLRALGVHGSVIPHDLSERAVCYRSRLAGRRILVVADDAASAAQVLPLVPGTPGCALLVTSRSHLEGLGSAHLVPLAMMTPEDAAELLTRLVGEDRVVAERDAADSLVEACGALPLALRIAGAKLAARPSWSLSLMARRMTGTQARLRELESGDLSVRASISSSYDSLPERLRRAFRLLALLGPADFAGWVVGALLGDPDAADVLDGLTNRSLIMPLGADATGEPRYRLHDLLRDFATERLAADPPAERRALERLLNGWLQLAMAADARLASGPYFSPPPKSRPPSVVPADVADLMTGDAITWFTAERVNLVAAVEHAARLGRLDLARRLAIYQSAYQYLQYRYDDVLRLWRLIGDRAEQSGDGAGATHARVRIAAAMVLRGEAAGAIAVLNPCLQGGYQAAELEDLAAALEWRATASWDLDDFDAARVDAERGAAMARLAGSRLVECGNLGVLSPSLAHLGQSEEAIAAGESALAIAQQLGTPTCELVALLNLATTYTLTGRHERSVPMSLRAIELSRGLGDISGEALGRGRLADAYQGLGRYQEAASSLLQALPTFSGHSSRRFHAVCLLKLGYAYEAMGSPEAIGYLEESLRIFRQLRLPRKADQAQQALDRCRAASALSASS